ncbi:MAG: M14 family metallopeptidase [Rhodothermales bacterium]
MPRAVLFALLFGVSPLAAQPADTLRTRAEQTDFRATSTYADVMAFVEAIGTMPGFHGTTFGTTVEGRPLPLMVWGADGASAEAVRAAGKLRVLVFANIHAGEVAGKEAALILLRELAAGKYAAWADSLVLLVAPIYNADGNERVDPGNRPYQHGPVDGMGQRSNAQDLDLNRDFVKLDAPESRALVALMDTYDPHVVIDLHTTNGTVHAYDLTYAPPLHPNTPAAVDALLRGAWLPAVTEAYKERYGGCLTYYGNDKPEWGQPRGWATFDPRPRFGTNYAGLRNRVGILSEAYSYATFEDRVRATLGFVTETLDWAHDHAGEIRRTVQQADAESVVGQRLALRAAGGWQASPEPETILLGEVVEEPNPHTGEPMFRRTEAVTPTEMTVYGRFAGSDFETAPLAYLVPDSLADVVNRLDAHGIRYYAAGAGLQSIPIGQEVFRIDSVHVAERPFQARHEREAFGRYGEVTQPMAAGTLVVPIDQPLGRMAFTLLEPRSDDGLVNWGLVPVEPGDDYPIRRLTNAEDVLVLEPMR